MSAATHILPMERWRFFCYASLFVFLSPLLFLIARARRRDFKDAPRILVVPILSRVGDLVCSTPVFRAIKLRYPKAHLAAIASKKAIGILRNNPRIDDLVNFNDLPFKGFFGRGRLFRYFFRERYDAVFCLSTSPTGTLMAAAAAAPIRVKTIVPRRSLGERSTDWLSNDRRLYVPGAFLQRHYLSLLSAIGIHDPECVQEVSTTSAGEDKADKFLSIIRRGNGPVIGVTVSAGTARKEWPLPRFASLADSLIERYGAFVVFIDSPANRPRVEECIRTLRNPSRASATTEFTLEELPSLVRRLSAFVAVDTGSIYIAHALGVPVVDIVGPVDPREQPPKDERSVQILPIGTPPVFSVFGTVGMLSDAKKAVDSIDVPAVLSGFEELARRGVFRITSKEESGL